MSASREKKSRQELNQTGYVDPAKAREAEKKAKERRTTRLYLTVIIAFVLLGAGLFAADRISAANEAKELARVAALPAVTVNDEEYSVSDVAYYYGSIYNTFANSSYSLFDTSVDAREQQYTADKTWHEYFLETALDYLKESAVLTQAAEAAGFDGTEAMDSAETSNLSMIDLYAAYSGVNREQYLSAMFGEYVTEDAFIRCVRRDALASAYYSDYSDSLSYSAAELKAAYEADPDDYCSADIEYILFSETPAEDATDADKEALLAEQKTLAETALERYAAGESLEAIADELGGTYQHRAHADRSVTSEMLSWAFDASRVEGDTTVASYSTTGYYAVLFHSRSLDDYHTVSVRHILVEDEATAEEILAEFKAGDATESDFSTLAYSKSTDSGTASSGGLMEDMRLGETVQAFEDWSFDASRKAGDTGIVESEYGFHVMYFVGTNELPAWELEATTNLKSDDLNAWYDAAMDGVTVEQLADIDYVG